MADRETDRVGVECALEGFESLTAHGIAGGRGGAIGGGVGGGGGGRGNMSFVYTNRASMGSSAEVETFEQQVEQV